MANGDQIRALFEQVTRLPPAEREAALGAASADADVTRAVRGMLASAGGAKVGSEWSADAADATTLQTEEQDHPLPRQIGPYRLVELIGQGGMGRVYRAQQEAPIRRTVAVKLIRAGFDSREVIARFAAERDTLSRLDHPNIARVLDAGRDDAGRPYFVMEYVPGVPVTQFCDDNRLLIEQRLRLFAQICEAVAHAHSKTVLHRDIKAGNVLAYFHDGQPTVKLIDFGIAKLLSGGASLDFNTRLDAVIGTYEYMSPEQAAGSGDIDTRSDVYSLGVLLYELLVGVRPLDRETIARMADLEVRRVIRDVEPPTPSVRLSALGDGATLVASKRHARPGPLGDLLRGELEWIPLKALRKERDRRYSSAADLRADIENYLARRPLTAGPESRVYRARKFVRRNRAGVVSAVLLVTALTLGVVGTSLGFLRAARGERAARSSEARAVLVSSFLEDVLGSANPTQAQGHQTLVADVLTSAAARLDELAAKDSLAAARAALTLGNAFSMLDDVPRTRDVATRANAWAEAAAAGDWDRRDRARVELAAGELLAYSAAKEGDVTASDRLAALCVTADRELGPQDSLAIELLSTRSDALRRARHLDESADLAREAIRRADAAPVGTVDPDQRWTALNNLAVALADGGKLGEAETVLRRVAAERRSALGPDHPNSILSNAGVAVAMDATGRSAEAVAMLRDAAERARRVLGPAHEATQTITDNLAAALGRSGDEAASRQTLTDLLALMEQRLPVGDVRMAMVCNNLGFLAMRAGRFDEAITYQTRAFESQRLALGLENPDTILTLGNIGDTRWQHGDKERGERELRQAIELGDRVMGRTHQQCVGRVNELCAMLEKDGRNEDSLTARRDVDARAREMRATDPVNAALYGTQLPLHLARLARWTEAWPLLLEAREALRSRGMATHALYPNVLRGLAAAAGPAGHLQDAAAFEEELRGSKPATRPATGRAISPATTTNAATQATKSVAITVNKDNPDYPMPVLSRHETFTGMIAAGQLPSGTATDVHPGAAMTRPISSRRNESLHPFLDRLEPRQMMAVTFAIDATADAHAISRFVYGVNQPIAGALVNATSTRAGGNRWTAYNWENNASNAGSDYQYQNDNFLGGGNVPGGAVKPTLDNASARNAAAIITVQLAGYVSADTNGGGDVRNSGADYLSTRFNQVRPRKGAAFSLTPNLTDDFVYIDEFANWIKQTYPAAAASPTKPIWFSLDNEPDLWQSTHLEVHPAAPTYAEVIGKSIDYATAIKDVLPDTKVFGPVSYGWYGYTRLQGAPDANNRDFLDTYLAQLRTASTAAGKRLVDALDLHWYPEATGGGVRITFTDDNSAAVVAARLQAPRSLWDPTYTETSWITQSLGGAPINLIPRMKAKIAANNPGTELAFTEYNYGGGGHISGGIAQADVLGIFGRESVFAANQWPLGGNESFVGGAFQSFRNYDGANAAFGDTSIRATNSDVSGASVYASLDSQNPNVLTIVAINKTANANPATITLNGRTLAVGANANIYQLTAASSSPRAAGVIAAGRGRQLRLHDAGLQRDDASRAASGRRRGRAQRRRIGFLL